MDRPLRRLRQRLNDAFKALEALGYFAKQNFEDCMSCAGAAMPKDRRDKYVFYHEQDTEAMEETGYLYLAWNGDSAEIVKTLQDNGLRVDWDGSGDSRMIVSYQMEN